MNLWIFVDLSFMFQLPLVKMLRYIAVVRRFMSFINIVNLVSKVVMNLLKTNLPSLADVEKLGTQDEQFFDDGCVPAPQKIL